MPAIHSHHRSDYSDIVSQTVFSSLSKELDFHSPILTESKKKYVNELMAVNGLLAMVLEQSRLLTQQLVQQQKALEQWLLDNSKDHEKQPQSTAIASIAVVEYNKPPTVLEQKLQQLYRLERKIDHCKAEIAQCGRKLESLKHPEIPTEMRPAFAKREDRYKTSVDAYEKTVQVNTHLAQPQPGMSKHLQKAIPTNETKQGGMEVQLELTELLKNNPNIAMVFTLLKMKRDEIRHLNVTITHLNHELGRYNEKASELHKDINILIGLNTTKLHSSLTDAEPEWQYVPQLRR